MTIVHVEPVINAVRAALIQQAAVAGADPVVETAAAQLVEALGPALRLAAIQLAEQAAAEVDAQLSDQRVDVLLTDGDPTLRVGERTGDDHRPPSAEDLDARITLRLPPSLKQLIEDAAQTTGDSVNGWVMDALHKRARRAPGRRGRDVTDSFDL